MIASSIIEVLTFYNNFLMLCVKINTYFIIVLLCLNGEAFLKKVKLRSFVNFSLLRFPHSICSLAGNSDSFPGLTDVNSCFDFVESD